MSTCGGCGAELAPNRGPGRQRIWCSDSCRKHALYSGSCVDCGAPTNSGNKTPPERCARCNAIVNTQRVLAKSREQRAKIERLWAEGLTARQIGAEMGWATSTARMRISELRAEGVDLPYRRKPKIVVMGKTVGAENLRKAREIYREQKAAA